MFGGQRNFSQNVPESSFLRGLTSPHKEFHIHLLPLIDVWTYLRWLFVELFKQEQRLFNEAPFSGERFQRKLAFNRHTLRSNIAVNSVCWNKGAHC